MECPLVPRQRAIFFDPGDQSGATIGHCCTIVEVDPDSRQRHPEGPFHWQVLVYFPHLLQYLEVEGGHLLPLDERDDSQLPSFDPPPLELSFVADAGDHERINGKYRKGSWYWRDFVFSKADQPLPTWQLHGNVHGSRFDLGEVVYFVPRTERLNRDYVEQAMRDILVGGR